jgi:hypothetical protein
MMQRLRAPSLIHIRIDDFSRDNARGVGLYGVVLDCVHLRVGWSSPQLELASPRHSRDFPEIVLDRAIHALHAVHVHI